MKETRNGVRAAGRHRRLPFTEKRDPFFFRAAAMRKRRWPTVLGALLLAGAMVAGVVVWQSHHSASSRVRAALERTVSQYLGAWGRGDWEAMQRLVAAPAPEDFASIHDQMFAGLHVGRARYEPGPIEEQGSSATVPFTAGLEVTGL